MVSNEEGRQGLTPQVVLWPTHMCYDICTPSLTRMNIHTHVVGGERKEMKAQTSQIPKAQLTTT